MIRWQPKPATPDRTFTDLAKASKYPLTGGLGLYFPRLEREGWTLLENAATSRDAGYYLWEKAAPGHSVLRKAVRYGRNEQPGKGVYWDEHRLLNRRTEVDLPFPNWEWADVDGSRLAWACEGKLWAGKLDREGLCEEKMLFDFEGMTFQEIKAPYG